MTPAVLPHDPEAERAVIGGVLVDPGLLDAASAIVTPEDFYSLHHRYPFAAMLGLAEDREPIDPLTVRLRLEEQGHLKDVGGPYLNSLTDGVPRSMNVQAYAAVVRELADRRHMIVTTRKLEAQAFDRGVPMLELYDVAQRAILDLTMRQSTGGFVSFADVLRETWPVLENARATLGQHHGITGLATGFDDLDARTGGLQPNRVYILGAPTSKGKTALAEGIALHAGTTLRVPVAVFSPEMSAHDLMVRAFAQVARVNATHLFTGSSTAIEWQATKSTVPVLARSSIFVDDSTTLTLAELRARARRLHAECGPLQLVIVDYVQLVHDPGLRAENRNIELGTISRALRALAKELHVPFIVLSQLKRDYENHEGGRPRLSDLKESGSLEQDADAVFLLHRPGSDTLAELIIAKNRSGQTGVVKLRWIPEQMRFANETDDAVEPPAALFFEAAP